MLPHTVDARFEVVLYQVCMKFPELFRQYLIWNGSSIKILDIKHLISLSLILGGV